MRSTDAKARPVGSRQNIQIRFLLDVLHSDACVARMRHVKAIVKAAEQTGYTVV